MAKKKRKERKQLSRERGLQQAAANVSRIDASAPMMVQPKAVARPNESGVATAIPVDEYAHIRSDLKRIALLAGSIVVILVALSFVI